VGVPNDLRKFPISPDRQVALPGGNNTSMNRIRTVLGVACLLLLLSVQPAHGQKIGTLNSVTFLEELPDVKRANVDLDALKGRLTRELEEKISKFEEKFEKARSDSESGKLSPVQEDSLARELEEEKRKIASLEREIQGRLLKKREELLTPILAKIDKALKAVAKENDYHFIFDVSAGGLLFATEGADVAPLVRAKLETAAGSE